MTIPFKRGELASIERSYKYTQQEVDVLLDRADLRQVQRWTDGHGYYLILAEKPAVYFSSTMTISPGSDVEVGLEEQHADDPASVPNPFGIPLAEDWEKLWKTWDIVTLGMVRKDLLHTKPIDLRCASIVQCSFHVYASW
jgi:L-histidine Nalpha-methyltransferase / hercynylcysteine S-oxide synthase